MSSKVFHIHLRKEALKFSAAHMTVFPDRSKEALHGHNYSTDVSIRLKEVGFENFISVSYFKDLVRKICQDWDEKILIAAHCSFMEILKDSDTEFDFRLCGKRYLLPRDEVVLLEVENISVECLADLFCVRLLENLNPSLVGRLIIGLEVRIEESSGQGASAAWSY